MENGQWAGLQNKRFLHFFIFFNCSQKSYRHAQGKFPNNWKDTFNKHVELYRHLPQNSEFLEKINFDQKSSKIIENFLYGFLKGVRGRRAMATPCKKTAVQIVWNLQVPSWFQMVIALQKLFFQKEFSNQTLW
jgi:hypothetical protein